MKRDAPTSRGASPQAESAPDRPAGRIHPVVIYPFKEPTDYSDLEELYALVARLDAERDRYARPITVLDRKSHYAAESSKSYSAFRKSSVSKHSDVVDAWCV